MKASLGEKISVCLLTYNHENVVESTLRSILYQTIRGYEILVSDDCSTDGTWEKILFLAKEDGRIRPIRTPRNLGMAGNANYAVSQCHRPYIALLHHDDLYREDLLEKWLQVMEGNVDIGFVFNQYGRYGLEDIYAVDLPGERIEGKYFLENILFPRWDCPSRGTAMIRREAWERVSGMRENFGSLADVDLWMRLSRQWAVGYVPESVIMVRHQRPDYYPDIYTGKDWSWPRLCYIFEIHATNRLAYFNMEPYSGRWRWWVFRLRLSLETAKWLTYAIVKRKTAMITTSDESKTNYDLWPLKLYRWGLRLVVNFMTTRIMR